MKKVGQFLLLATFLWAQQADLTILVETSHLTCGKPIELAQQALIKALCDRPSGKVAVAVFSRIQGAQTLTWLTTPVQPLGDDECLKVFSRIQPRCDSIYQVNLFHAIEEAINKGYSSHILILLSGKETGRGISEEKIRQLASKNNVELYFAAIGWLANDETIQSFLKRLSGALEGEKDKLRIIDPKDPQAGEKLRSYITQVWRKVEESSQKAAIPEIPASAQPAPTDTRKEEAIPLWVWIAGGAAVIVIVVLILVLVLRPSSKPTPPPPPSAAPYPAAPASAAPSVPPAPVAPPAPVIRRLIVSYPHTQQEINLSASTAPITLGRAPDNTVVIADNTVSSRHARLFLQGNQWYVQDLGSTNGTFVNEQRVTQHPVRIGDKIRLGAIIVQIAG